MQLLELSKKYNPVIAKLDLVFFGFSIKLTIFFPLRVTTPNLLGFLTGYVKITII